MNIVKLLTKIVGSGVAMFAMSAAQSASKKSCFIFHQEEIPEKLRSNK